MMIEEIKEKSEKILYQTKPKRIAYAIGNPISFFIGIAWGLFDLNFLRDMFTFTKVEGSYILVSETFSIGILLFFLIHLTPFWYGVFSPIFRWFSWKKINYYITNKRIYIIIKKNTSNIELKKISNLNVKVNFLENFFKVGTIDFQAPSPWSTYESLFSKHGMKFKMIEEPYEVYNKIKEIIEKLEKNENDTFKY